MSEKTDKFLSVAILRRTKEFALRNMDSQPRFREGSDNFFTRVYIESFLDALMADDYTITIEKDNESIILKKGK